MKLRKKIFSATTVSCLAVVGFAATVVFAVKATPKAIDILEKEKKKKSDNLSKLEIVKATAPIYAPTAILGTATVICILGADMLNKRKQKALISSYILVENAYKQYKDKLIELYGEEAHHKIEEAIIMERCEDDTVVTVPGTFGGVSSLDIKTDETKRLFYDFFSKRYFETTLSKVLQAEYHLNRNLILRGAARLNEFYEFLGLEKTDYGDTVGWNTYNEMLWVDFDHYMATMDDSLECCIIEMIFEPTTDYLELL